MKHLSSVLLIAFLQLFSIESSLAFEIGDRVIYSENRSNGPIKIVGKIVEISPKILLKLENEDEVQVEEIEKLSVFSEDAFHPEVDEVGEALGTGTSATVYEATLKGYIQKYAIRTGASYWSESKYKKLMGKNWRGFQGVVDYYGNVVYQNKSYNIFEKMDGDVGKLIEKKEFVFDADMITVLTEGLEYIFHMGEVYSDIKPGNILARKTKDGHFIVKFTDITSETTESTEPEILPGNLYKIKNYETANAGKRITLEQKSLSSLGLTLIQLVNEATTGSLSKELKDRQKLIEALKTCGNCLDKEFDNWEGKDTIFWGKTLNTIGDLERHLAKGDRYMRGKRPLPDEFIYPILLGNAKYKATMERKLDRRYVDVIEKMMYLQYPDIQSALADLRKIKSSETLEELRSEDLTRYREIEEWYKKAATGWTLSEDVRNPMTPEEEDMFDKVFEKMMYLDYPSIQVCYFDVIENNWVPPVASDQLMLSDGSNWTSLHVKALRKKI